MDVPGRGLRSRVARAERVTGAVVIALTLLGMAGTARAGGAFLDGPAVTAGWTGTADFQPDGIVPLAHGHSHNDYDRRVPLSDAIEHGYTSVEADVWRIGRRLLVGHEVLDAAAGDRTLAQLYLDPLKTWIDQHGGSVFPDRRVGFTLLVDVKANAGSAYRSLDALLARYASILTTFTPDGVKRGPVTVVVSGRRDTAALETAGVRYAALDGRLADVERHPELPVSTVPLVSEKWTAHFRWKGVGDMPAAERVKLGELVAAVHAQGRALRLYDTPAPSAAAREAVWREEMAAQVDLLNIDDLAAGEQFLLGYEDPSRPYAHPAPEAAQR